MLHFMEIRTSPVRTPVTRPSESTVAMLSSNDRQVTADPWSRTPRSSACPVGYMIACNCSFLPGATATPSFWPDRQTFASMLSLIGQIDTVTGYTTSGGLSDGSLPRATPHPRQNEARSRTGSKFFIIGMQLPSKERKRSLGKCQVSSLSDEEHSRPAGFRPGGPRFTPLGTSHPSRRLPSAP